MESFDNHHAVLAPIKAMDSMTNAMPWSSPGGVLVVTGRPAEERGCWVGEAIGNLILYSRNILFGYLGFEERVYFHGPVYS